MTTPSSQFTQAIAHAIEEVRASYPGLPVTVRSDEEGGAFIVIEGVDLGPLYNQSSTWVGFRITFQYPEADVYPHYVRHDLGRKDGNALGEGLHANHSFETRPATMISRRSNHLNPALDTAAIKLLKVLAWLRNRP